MKKLSLLDAKKPNRILLLTITFLLIILLPILVIVVRERTSFTGRAVSSFTCTASSPCVGKIISETIYPPTPVPFPTGRPTPQTTRPPFPPRTNYYLEKSSGGLFLLMWRTTQIDFSQYADSEREVVVLGEGSAGFMMNVGGNLVRRAIGVIVVSDISWAD